MSEENLVDLTTIQQAIASGFLAMVSIAQSTADALSVTTSAGGTIYSEPEVSSSTTNGSDGAGVVDTTMDVELDNVTLNGTDTNCQEWQPTQHPLFQTANMCYVAAFLIPHNFRMNMLLVRFILSVGFFMFTLWAGVYICAPDIFAWNFTFLCISVCHVLYLCWKHFPPRIRPEYADLYSKVFEPLKMDKQHFSELVRDAEVLRLEEDAHYAVEDVTAADERLSILLNGKLKITCENTHLHYILPNQFIDSPEWEACPTDSDELFQVTVTAVEPSQYLCWQRRRLRTVLRNKPFLDSVIYNLIGKDITQKLYSLNEHMSAIGRLRQNPASADIYWKHHFPRSLSVDMVDTGMEGHVRSYQWRMHSTRNCSVHSDSLEAGKPSPMKHKVHFPQTGVNHAMAITAGWISESFRRMAPSESHSERVPLWSHLSRSISSAHHNTAVDR